MLNTNITAARERLGITKSEMARRCDVAKSTVTAWESGSSCPRPDQLKKLAAVLHVSVADLYAERGAKARAASK